MAVSRRSAEKEAFWRLVVDEHKASGLSVRAFCKRESVSAPSLYAWRRELERRDRSGEQPPDALVPVHVVDDGKYPTTELSGPPTLPASPAFEVETPNGFKMRFNPQIDAAKLRALLQLVASCSGHDAGLHEGSSC